MNYVNSDFDKMDGIWDDIMGVVTGQTSISTVVSNLAYDEAMKQISKNADVVKSFANKAVSASNAVAAKVQAMSLATTQQEADSILQEAKKQEAATKVETSNAAKNYALTQTAMKTLLNIKGLPQSVIDSANAILTGSKKSLDTANTASQRATQALASVQTSYNSKYGSFLTNLPGFSSMSPMSSYLIIGGGVVALSLLGLVAYKMIKKKGAANG